MSDLLTYLDALDHLQSFVGGNAFAREMADMRQAVRSAYATIRQEQNWSYYRSRWAFNTVAAYDTGTITYDHTGGDSERMLTLSAAGTWPSWTTSGKVVVGGVAADITSVSDQVATLDADNNLGADVDAGTSYTLYRNLYTLPADFKSVENFLGDNQYIGRYLDPGDFVRLRNQNLHDTGTPWAWTVMSDPNSNNAGRYVIGLHPAPTSVDTYDVAYERAARDLKITGTETDSTAGTVTATTTALAGTGTSFADKHVGSVIRFGTTTAAPTGVVGSNVYTDQQFITARTSATAATLDAAPSPTSTDVNYVISDPVDIAPEMQVAFLDCCRLKLATLRGDKMRELLPELTHTYQQSLSLAKRMGNKTKVTRAFGGGPGKGQSFTSWARYLPSGDDDE
jgi:hypothetical protein